MSVFKRLGDLARSNLTDVLDNPLGDLRDLFAGGESPDLTEDLPREDAPRRATTARTADEVAWERAYKKRKAGGVRSDPVADPVAERQRWYAALEVGPGADLKTVRRSYRKLLLKFHPDRFATQPDKQKAATEVTRRLTAAYNGLTNYLGGAS